MLHDLRALLEAQGCRALAGDATVIRLRPEMLAIRPARPGPLRPELLGIDPQLDRWLSEAAADDTVVAAFGREAAAPEPRSAATPVETPLSLAIRPLTGFGLPNPGALEGEVTDALIAAISRLRSISLIIDSGVGGPCGTISF